MDIISKVIDIVAILLVAYGVIGAIRAIAMIVSRTYFYESIGMLAAAVIVGYIGYRIYHR